MFCDEMKVIRKPVPSGSHIGIRGGRYVGYEQVCKEYDWCFATDFRDVYFQADPFKSISKNNKYDIILPEEDRHVTIGSCPHNKGWIGSCWPTLLQNISREHIICSGTIFATPSGMKRLKEAMMSELDVSSKKKGCLARDQGHLNFLFYSHRLGDRVLVQRRGNGIVNTVGQIRPRNTIINYMDEKGHILNEDKTISAVIHQYDRFPAIVESLSEMLRSLDYN